MITPLNNNVLIEIIDENEGLIADTSDEMVTKGILRAAHLIPDHMTASVGYTINNIQEYAETMATLTDKIVYFEEYSDTGKRFKVGSKQYSLIPFYRIIGYEEESNNKG